MTTAAAKTTPLMSRDTLKREREWVAARNAAEKADERRRAAEDKVLVAKRLERKALEQYEFMLMYDGVDFDERQREREAFKAILSALPA